MYNILKKEHIVAPRNSALDMCVNVSGYATDPLGIKLAYGCPCSTNTVFGVIGTVKAGMDFIVTPNYPLSVLGKRKRNAGDIRKIPRKKISVSNYWAIVAYIVCERVKQDPELIELIADNTKEYTSYNCRRSSGDIGNVIIGGETTVKVINASMGKYLGIIRHIERLIKDDRFTDENIVKLINECKEDPEVGLFDKSTVNITMHE